MKLRNILSSTANEEVLKKFHPTDLKHLAVYVMQ